ncbi:MAG TPA: YbhB/YbcL family Raf kinase inhibitor-like protein [Deltaproteobacteria bacterium]|nr:YbhB/YbcL family Raf kinase inhibitor-like protein [Deltaproteobacteria bacterium]
MAGRFRLPLAGALLLVGMDLDPAFAGNEGGKQMKVTSQAFADGEMIPAKYTCNGENVSPPIAWQRVPEGTRSITIIAEDPDAPMGNWVHWVYYDIPPEISGLPEDIPAEEKPGPGGTQGINDALTIGYIGPCPPSGIHRYYFRIYAVDTELDLPPGANSQEVLQAMEGHLLGMGELMGRFRR